MRAHPLISAFCFHLLVALVKARSQNKPRKMAEKRPLDTEEEEKVDKFYREGCGCKIGPEKGQCYLLFTKDEIRDRRDSILELTSSEKDFLLLGFILANKPKNGETTYMIHGKRVCRETFLFCLTMSLSVYQTLCKHFKEKGPVAREHGNKGRLPHNTFSMKTNEHAITFLKNFAELNASYLPGRIPYCRDEKGTTQFINSHHTKKSIHESYHSACLKEGLPAMGFSAFRDLWKKALPNIVVAKTMADLCWTCQQGNNLLIRARAKHKEGDDSGGNDDYDEALKSQEDHIIRAAEEIRYYRAQVKRAKDDARKFLQLEGMENFNAFSKKPPCSFKGMSHYSWDYAQQTHYPYHPLQPGPIFFKTPRKCSIFGLCNDGIGLQYCYLIDEIVNTGKGANATISYVHHYLENYSFGETEAYLHADNCSGMCTFGIFLHFSLFQNLFKIPEFRLCLRFSAKSTKMQNTIISILLITIPLIYTNLCRE